MDTATLKLLNLSALMAIMLSIGLKVKSEEVIASARHIRLVVGGLAADFVARIHLLIYYSFVTLTTVGYGDVTPVTAPARTCAWFEAMTGQFYLAVLVAGLVGALINKGGIRHGARASTDRAWRKR